MPKGEHLRGRKPPGSGRKKGVKDKKKVEFETASQILERMNMCPIERMARMADGDVPCGVCFGKGKTLWQAGKKPDDLRERICQSCYGSCKEKISPELRQRCLAELANYKHAKLKAVEHTGPAGGPIQHAVISVEFVRAKTDGPVS